MLGQSFSSDDHRLTLSRQDVDPIKVNTDEQCTNLQTNSDPSELLKQSNEPLEQRKAENTEFESQRHHTLSPTTTPPPTTSESPSEYSDSSPSQDGMDSGFSAHSSHSLNNEDKTRADSARSLSDKQEEDKEDKSSQDKKDKTNERDKEEKEQKDDKDQKDKGEKGHEERKNKKPFDQVVRIDRFGRVRRIDETYVDEERSAEEKNKRQAEALLWTSRERKWIKMTKNWGKYEASEKLKRRIRKGIPDSVRALVWAAFVGINPKIKEQPNLYRTLLARESEHSDTISRDINRTFPEHILFRDENSSGKSMGREALFNVLKAYSIYDREVGYCQGMGFIAGIFLMYMSEEESFWMLESLMRSPKFFLNGLYSPGFPLLHQYFYQYEQLLKKRLPKLFNHLNEENVNTQLYGTQWFITLFSYNLPFEIVLRLWDILLAEGTKILFRMALHIMMRNEQLFLTLDFPGIVTKLKDIHKEPFMRNADGLIRAILKVDMTTAGLERTAKEYQVLQFQEKQSRKR